MTPTTPTTPAPTWRDLVADHLTAEQVAYLEDWEQHPHLPPRADGAPRSPEQQRESLLFAAREFAALNAAEVAYAHIAPPADACRGVGDWSAWGDGEHARLFTSWADASGRVSVCGWQFGDGRTERFVLAEVEDEGLSAEQARALGAALIEAADVLGRLA